MIQENIIIILTLSILSYLFLWLWYSPILFMNPWIKMSKLKSKMSPPAWVMLAGFLMVLVLQIALNIISNNLLLINSLDSLLVGLFIWISFYATTQISVFVYEQKPFKLFLINSVPYLIIISISLIVNSFF